MRSLVLSITALLRSDQRAGTWRLGPGLGAPVLLINGANNISFASWEDNTVLGELPGSATSGRPCLMYVCMRPAFIHLLAWAIRLYLGSLLGVWIFWKPSLGAYLARAVDEVYGIWSGKQIWVSTRM